MGIPTVTRSHVTNVRESVLEVNENFLSRKEKVLVQKFDKKLKQLAPFGTNSLYPAVMGKTGQHPGVRGIDSPGYLSIISAPSQKQRQPSFYKLQ